MAHLFRTSTQFKRWMMDEEKLRCKREEANRLCIASIKQHATSTVSESDLVTVDEENALQVFYMVKGQELCQKLGMPRKVLATSIAYIKRFYLKYSVMDFNPGIVMLTSVYLAGKTEESYRSAEEIAKVVRDPRKEKAILKFESQLICDLEFQLIVFNPYRPIEGFCIFLEDWLIEHSHGNEKAEELTKNIKCRAYQLNDRLLLSDVVFLYPPSQCALAMMRIAMQQEGLDATKFTERACNHAGDDEMKTISSLDMISDLLYTIKVPSEELVKGIDLKLKKYRNPLYDETSDLYKKNKELEDQRKAERKRRKQIRREQMNKADDSLQAELSRGHDTKRRKSGMI